MFCNQIVSHTVDEVVTYFASHEDKATTPYFFEINENAVDPR